MVNSKQVPEGETEILTIVDTVLSEFPDPKDKWVILQTIKQEIEDKLSDLE